MTTTLSAEPGDRSARDSRHTRSWPATVVALPETRWVALATVLFAIGGLTQLADAPAPLFWVCYLGAYAAGGGTRPGRGWRRCGPGPSTSIC